MPHQFKKIEVKDLFRDKKVVFIGDSIIRDIYKGSILSYLYVQLNKITLFFIFLNGPEVWKESTNTNNSECSTDFVWLYGDGKLITNEVLLHTDKENKTSQPALPVVGGGERLIPGTGLLTGSLTKG